MHNFIKFHFGPHWSLQIQGNSRSSKISPTEIRTCLSQLPFLYTSGKLSIRSCDALCFSEQVQVSEDLRTRLTGNLLSCCNSTFIHQTQSQANQHRNSFFSSRTKHQSFDFNDMIKTTTTTTWAYCFLFTREKIVAQCSNTDELPDDFIYFLKLLVSHYLQEKHETGNTVRSTTLPQNISSNSTSTSTVTNNTMTTTTVANNASPTSSNSATTTTSSSHQSSLAYVYDANSSSTPFKIREKSASSVTVVSSDSSISYWSNPLSNNLTHHLIKSPLHDTRTPSNVLIPQLKQQAISDVLNNDDYSNSIPFLSSSVPSDSTTQTTKATASFNPFDHDGISSAPSSPVHRSRSHSLSSNNNNSNEDSSLKHMLTNLINGEASYLDQTEDVKLVRRWIKLDGHVYLANFILILLSDGLCSVVVCKDDPEKSKPSKSPWKPMSSQVKKFKSQLRSCLSDFTMFLLTKEATHFTNLSFAVTYPGLVHFVHLNRGVMVSPLLVDLNELDKNHELLHEMYGKYYNTSATDQCIWKWPSESNLKKLCQRMLLLGISCRHNPIKNRVLQESSNREYYFLYQRVSPHQELLAIYFSIVPVNRLWKMHQKLFQDISQRVL
ncbi:hypothetical protein BDF21DRAFT_345656 [Thamnidium elegans]|nr:hypothetical protein BDF21DRAFT_345656 [Thamnidium elegans]